MTMAKVLLAALLMASFPSMAQMDGGAVAPPATLVPSDIDAIRREMEQRMEAQKRELTDQISELRGQLATQAVSEGWQKEWVEEKRKLELFTLDGYFRVRPDLFSKFDLNESPDPSGYFLFPPSPVTKNERTLGGVNMRARLEPTLNVSEDVRFKAQIDLLDNVIWGSTPEYAFSQTDRINFGIFSETQSVPRSAINDVKDSISVKRVYGEVATPVGLLRAGRMGVHWGLGMLRNDGNCLDCDHGDTVDRAMFVAEPLEGFYIAPSVDFNVEGPNSATTFQDGQPYDLSNLDDSHSYNLAITRRDTDAQAKAKLENNQSVFNYGAYFTYRVQNRESVDFYNQKFINQGGAFNNLGGGNADPLATGYVPRGGSLYVPDIWLKFERKNFRIEFEGAGAFGKIKNRAVSGADANDPSKDQALSILQFGAVLQAEYRLMEQALRLHFEAGYASGDKAPGLGNHPGRNPYTADGSTIPGDIDGPQYSCPVAGTCTGAGSDNRIANFQFNRDYRIDMILWREILGPVTDAVYLKPGAKYYVSDGLSVFADLIYSRTIYASSTPSSTSPQLGVEIDAGVRYETEDGFFAQLRYGVLFPLEGLRAINQTGNLSTAMAVRGLFGIKF